MFFNKEGQLKRWAVIVFTILLPVLFSIWGIYLSRASYVLAIETNKNREQMDTLTAIVKQLRAQNDLLKQSVKISQDQFDTYTKEVGEGKKPRLKAQLLHGEIGEISFITVKVTNYGGNAHKLKFYSNTVKVEADILSGEGRLPAGASCVVTLSNLKSGDRILLLFRDDLGRDLSQTLTWNLKNESLEFEIIQQDPGI